MAKIDTMSRRDETRETLIALVECLHANALESDVRPTAYDLSQRLRSTLNWTSNHLLRIGFLGRGTAVLGRWVWLMVLATFVAVPLFLDNGKTEINSLLVLLMLALTAIVGWWREFETEINSIRSLKRQLDRILVHRPLTEISVKRQDDYFEYVCDDLLRSLSKIDSLAEQNVIFRALRRAVGVPERREAQSVSEL